MKITDDIFYELEKILQGVYGKAEVEVPSDITPMTLYIHFNNSLNSSLVVMENEGNVWIGGFNNFKSEIYKPTLICEDDFDFVDLGTLIKNVDMSVKKIQKDEGGFYQDGLDAFADYGMTKADHDRIYGKPDLVGEQIMIVKYIIFGVELYAIENADGYILKYCDTKEQAIKQLRELI